MRVEVKAGLNRYRVESSIYWDKEVYMDISEQIEKRVRLDEINHEIAGLNKKYETNVNKDGLLMVSDPEDKARLDHLLKMKAELEEELDEA